MKIITLSDLMASLAELNENYPRYGIAPLELSPLLDVKDESKPWPHAGSPGVYALFNERQELLYLGKASCNTNLGYRLGAHFNKRGEPKSEYFAEVRYVAAIPLPYDRAFEAPAVEEFLISRLNPSLCTVGRTVQMNTE